MSEFKLVLKTSRILTSSVAGLAMFNILLQNNQFPPWVDLLQSLPIVFATMTGFIINDIYDYQKDSKGNLQRPIALGLVPRERAAIYAIVFALCALFLEGFVNQFHSVDILFVTLLGVLVYSPISKKLPTLKSIATAGLTLTPIFYASAILDKLVPLFIYIATATFIIGREILLDTKDYERDMKSDIKTLVAYLGKSVSQYIAWFLMFVGVCYFILNIHNLIGIVIAGLGLFSLVMALIIDRKKQLNNGGITIITMILCILSIPFAL
jgi:4-hydroxybenzoate polyprenyltransferase